MTEKKLFGKMKKILGGNAVRRISTENSEISFTGDAVENYLLCILKFRSFKACHKYFNLHYKSYSTIHIVQ